MLRKAKLVVYYDDKYKKDIDNSLKKSVSYESVPFKAVVYAYLQDEEINLSCIEKLVEGEKK